MASELDEGDLNAALARVTLFPTMYATLDADCECGENLLNGADSSVILLALVNKVALHQPKCPQVQGDLQREAAESIRHSGFLTTGDFSKALGGDAMVANDPLVKEIYRQLPPGPSTPHAEDCELYQRDKPDVCNCRGKR